MMASKLNITAEEQQSNMMEFAELNDKIGADDWLIPREEITRRRLIKQTPRYTIYKADWFGDVLLYEPTKAHEKISTRQKQERQSSDRRREFNQSEINSRFQQLNLRLSDCSCAKKACPLSPTTSLCSDAGSLESGYSSISSTPQYHTKHNLRSEFEFPSASTWTSMSSLELDEIGGAGATNEEGAQEDEQDFLREEPGNAGKLKWPRTTFPVVLNRDSFKFGPHSSAGANNNCHRNEVCDYEKVEEEEEGDEDDCSVSENTWFELNELRLIAHESFMLFMGACVEPVSFEESTSDQSTALVMQMSHPKATSLHNLLHASNSAATISPSERFFANRQRILDLEAKLNICQQVTNAMTYLHDKNIVHGKLTSANIYIELNQRVKISLIDNDEQQLVATASAANNSCHLDHVSPCAGPFNCSSAISFNLPALTYLSPELVRTIEIGDAKKTGNGQHVEMDTRELTKKSDVFSFGTLLFELFEERFPFSRNSHSERINDLTAAFSPMSNGRHFAGSPLFTPSLLSTTHRQQSPFVTLTKIGWNGNIKTSASELIYHIGSGQINHRNKVRPKCPALVDLVIEACWALEPQKRPSFKQISFECIGEQFELVNRINLN